MIRSDAKSFASRDRKHAIVSLLLAVKGAINWAVVITSVCIHFAAQAALDCVGGSVPREANEHYLIGGNS